MKNSRQKGLYSSKKPRVRWGKKKYKDNRDWIKTNEMYVVRGEYYLDFDFVKGWDRELQGMNQGKVGAPFKFPESFMRLLAVWHQFVDYRGLEGIARSLERMHIIPQYHDYTTAWHRIGDMKPEVILPDYDELEVGGDGIKFNVTNVTQDGMTYAFQENYGMGDMIIAYKGRYMIIIEITSPPALNQSTMVNLVNKDLS